jgi:hypothetical protein
MTSGQLMIGNYYCLKDLSRVYFSCWGLPYGKNTKPCSLMMNWAKFFKNSREVVFLGNLLEDISCPRIRCNGWTFIWDCGQALIRLPFARIVQIAFLDHHQIFKATFGFMFLSLLLVHAIYEKQ